MKAEPAKLRKLFKRFPLRKKGDLILTHRNNHINLSCFKESKEISNSPSPSRHQHLHVNSPLLALPLQRRLQLRLRLPHLLLQRPNKVLPALADATYLALTLKSKAASNSLTT